MELGADRHCELFVVKHNNERRKGEGERGREGKRAKEKKIIKDRIKIRFIFYKGSSVPMLLNHHSENCQSYKVYIMLCY